MGMRPDYDYSKPLPEKYEAMMPANKISSYEKYQWREHKVNELYMNGLAVINENNEYVILDDEASENSDVNNKVEDVDTDDAEEYTENDDENDGLEEVDDADDVVVKSKSKSKSAKPAKSSTVKKKNNTNNQDDNSGFEEVKYMPKSAMNALRQIFPDYTSKADLISAAAYILSDGNCNISDKAMSLVTSYKRGDKFDSIEDRLSRLERLSKRQLDLLYSTELAACYTAFDRRYGATAPRTGPKTHEFREPENLDMLERLREQAQDQRHIDELKMGREIYDQIKDKND